MSLGELADFYGEYALEMQAAGGNGGISARLAG